MKKRKLLSLISFVIGFIVTYMILCYGIQGLRIKLEAVPMVYFIESIKFAALFKTVISCVAGTILAVLPYIFKNKQRR